MSDACGQLKAENAALRKERDRYKAALREISDGDMPKSWHPNNVTWWMATVAWKALRLAEWGYGVEAAETRGTKG